MWDLVAQLVARELFRMPFGPRVTGYTFVEGKTPSRAGSTFSWPCFVSLFAAFCLHAAHLIQATKEHIWVFSERKRWRFEWEEPSSVWLGVSWE